MAEPSLLRSGLIRALQVSAIVFGSDKTASINASYPIYIDTVVIFKEKSREIKWRVENAEL